MAFHCDACDFTYDLAQASRAGDRIAELAADIAAILTRRGVDTRHRPHPEVWSPLEYAVHVRDVLLAQRERVLAARRTSGAVCAELGRDERIAHDGYNAQDPQAVARQLDDTATVFNNVLHRLGDDDWDRTVVYNYPETQERSLRWLAIHTVHDVRHHLADIRNQL